MYSGFTVVCELKLSYCELNCEFSNIQQNHAARVEEARLPPGTNARRTESHDDGDWLELQSDEFRTSPNVPINARRRGSKVMNMYRYSTYICML